MRMMRMQTLKMMMLVKAERRGRNTSQLQCIVLEVE
jgi:hypothetical protein